MKITHCKLKKSLQKKLLEFFVAEVTARTAADLLGIQPNTAALFYHKIRLVIEHHLALEAHEIFEGKIEVDESYFGGHRKGKRGRGAAGKVAVFGLLKRQGKVFTNEFHHERINHSELFAEKQNHINGIENFWNQAKRVLRKYNGINRKNFPLFLKECEFRFNFGTPKEQLKTLRKWCEI
ncbi:transposase [Mannheimia haemolytica]|nr:transposase [Mannheimia haemolytica]